MRNLILVFGFGLVSLLLSSCATGPSKMKAPKHFTSLICQEAFETASTHAVDQQLDEITDLFNSGCFHETITLGSYLREQHRDKFYSLSTEAIEIFTPEGTLTPYVLESYERSVLSLFVAASFLKLNRPDDALVELRRITNEENAILYNYGDDPIVTLMLAALWDRFDPNIARPLWKKLSEWKNQEPHIRLFAESRMKEIDRNAQPVDWKIFGLGQLPELDWQPQLFKKSPYKITSKEKQLNSCSAVSPGFRPEGISNIRC